MYWAILQSGLSFDKKTVELTQSYIFLVLPLTAAKSDAIIIYVIEYMNLSGVTEGTGPVKSDNLPMR